MSTSARIDHPRLHWGVLLTTLVVFGFSLWATYFITQLSRTFVARQARSSFDQETLTTQNQIKAHLNEYLGALRATQGLVLSSQEVERPEWAEFIATLNLPAYYPGMSELALIEKVPLSDQEAFIEAVRQDTSLQPQGYPDFTIHPETTQNELLVIKYVAPATEQNVTLLGRNYSADPETALAAQRAEETGMPAATRPMADPTDPTDQTFSIALPTYPTVGSSAASLVGTEADGFVVAFFKTDHLFSEFFGDHPLPAGVELEVYSGATPKPENLLYKNFDERTYDWQLLPEWLYAHQSTVEVGGQTWTLRFSAPKTFGLSPFEQNLPQGLLVGGLLFTLGLCVVVAGLDTSRFRAVELAQKMTADLQKSEAQYRTIFESLQDVYYRTDAEGRITVISPSITKYIGLKPEEVIGHLATDFYTNPRERDQLLKELASKGSVTDYQINLQGQGAQTLTASLNAHILLDETGRPVGVEGVLRDVTQRKEDEKRLQERTLDVERANRMMIDRELRMIELKKEIESLKARLNLT